jgi:hypothetical protein
MAAAGATHKADAHNVAWLLCGSIDCCVTYTSHCSTRISKDSIKQPKSMEYQWHQVQYCTRGLVVPHWGCLLQPNVEWTHKNH